MSLNVALKSYIFTQSEGNECIRLIVAPINVFDYCTSMAVYLPYEELLFEDFTLLSLKLYSAMQTYFCSLKMTQKLLTPWKTTFAK